MKWNEVKNEVIYIFRIFLVFSSKCEILTGSGPAEKAVQEKRICLREILRQHFVFKKFIKNFFMHLNTYRNIFL